MFVGRDYLLLLFSSFFSFLLRIYTTSLLERVFLWVCHNNDYTSIGYKHGNIMSNIIHFLVQDYLNVIEYNKGTHDLVGT